MKSACVGVLSIIELKNAPWNSEIYNCCYFVPNGLLYLLPTKTDAHTYACAYAI